MAREQEWTAVGLRHGLRAVEQEDRPEHADFAMVGSLEGFPVAVIHRTPSGGHSLAVVAVLPEGADGPAAAKEAGARAKGFKARAEGDVLTLEDRYSFSAPDGDALRGALEALASVLPGTGPAPTKCRTCAREGIEVRLVDGLPVPLCEECLATLLRGRDVLQAEYDAIRPNLEEGLLYGALAGLAGAVAWAYLARNSGKVFMIVGLGVGFLVGFAVKKGMRRVTPAGKAAAIAITLGSAALGDLLTLVPRMMKQRLVPFSFDLVREAFSIYPDVVARNPKGLLLSLVFGAVGAYYALKVAGTRPPTARIG